MRRWLVLVLPSEGLCAYRTGDRTIRYEVRRVSVRDGFADGGRILIIACQANGKHEITLGTFGTLVEPFL